jgi:hyperosmotically inducible protein
MKANTNIMKRISSLCLGTMLGVALLSAGCAGSRYERSTGESIDDKATVSRVKTALHSDAVYKYPDVDVSSFKGTVQLSGFVDNKEQKERAGEITKSVEGVKELKNNIALKP